MRARVRAAWGYGRSRVWVITATPVEAARGPATRRREIRDRECETYTRGFHSSMWEQSNPHGVEDRTAPLLR